jgi:hypothetical protein
MGESGTDPPLYSGTKLAEATIFGLLKDGKAQEVGRSESQKTCLDVLHGVVFEDKTVKGSCG